MNLVDIQEKYLDELTGGQRQRALSCITSIIVFPKSSQRFLSTFIIDEAFFISRLLRGSSRNIKK